MRDSPEALLSSANHQDDETGGSHGETDVEDHVVGPTVLRQVVIDLPLEASDLDIISNDKFSESIKLLKDASLSRARVINCTVVTVHFYSIYYVFDIPETTF